MRLCKQLVNHLILTLLAVVLMAVPALAATEATTVDSVATVNGTPITRERYNQETQRASKQFSRPGQPVPDAMKKMLQDRVLDFLVGEELLHQRCQLGMFDAAEDLTNAVPHLVSVSFRSG